VSTMSDEESLYFIFRSGLSTAASVSDVSGRGVGLDVVATVVNRVGGEVFVETEPRKGTTFTLEIPLTREEKASVAVA